jgi:predicted metal-dependent phosphoesterase TrpH
MGKADLHIHTNFSDGLGSPRDVVKAASRAGLQVIAVFRAREYSKSRPDLGVEVIVGEEISSLNGHVIGLFLEKFIPPRLTAERTVSLVHQQGGIAILAHPFHPYTGKSSEHPRAIELLDRIPLDGMESLNHGEFYGSPFNAKAAKLCGEMGLAEVGSSDAHDPHFVGMAYTDFPGTTTEELRAALLARRTRARASRAWGAKEVFRHLKGAVPVLTRYSKLPSAAV